MENPSCRAVCRTVGVVSEGILLTLHQLHEVGHPRLRWMLGGTSDKIDTHGSRRMCESGPCVRVDLLQECV